MSSSSPSPPAQLPQPPPHFPHFPYLPPEIRLQIWRLSLPYRTLEMQLFVPPHTEASISDILVDLRPLARPPALPVALHICRESRLEVLSLYRECSNNSNRMFGSPYAFPHDLWLPERDTLFVPMALHTLEAYLQSGAGAEGQARARAAGAGAEFGVEVRARREFILERMAMGGRGDVQLIRYLAISWADMHVRDVPSLVRALEPFESLQELSLMFFEMRRDTEDVRLMSMKRGQLRAVLVDPAESSVRGRYLERILEAFVELAATLNAAFKEEDSLRSLDGRGRRKLPEVKIKMVRFEP